MWNLIGRLADEGHDVVGLECAEKGCKEFFTEQDIPYTVSDLTECEGKVFKVCITDWLDFYILSRLFLSDKSEWVYD